MDERQRLIDEARFLIRGTTDYAFKQRMQEGNYYGVRRNGELVTSATLDLFSAFFYARYRTKEMNNRGYKTRPLVIVVDAEKYRGRMKPGIEFEKSEEVGGFMGLEVEIIGPIAFLDIQKLDSARKLNKFVNPSEAELDYFRRKILGEN